LKDGKIDGWHHRITGSSVVARWLPPAFTGNHNIDFDTVDSAIDIPYAIPNLKVDVVRHEPPVPTGFWRGVGPNNNVFAIESFMDELAKKAGADPVEFRRAHLAKNPRLLAALNLAADKAGWGTSLPPGHGRGVSAQLSFASFIVTVAHVEVTDAGNVRLHKLTTAVDTGIAVNPDTVTAQLQGGMIFGSTARLPHAADQRDATDRHPYHSQHRAAGRHRRDRRHHRAARHPQCHLCRHRRSAPASAHRPRLAGGKAAGVNSSETFAKPTGS
jgi:isoquinoline 1-oxidoreductase beta subunit